MNVKFTFDDNKIANIKIDSFEIKGFDNAIFDGKVIVLGSTVDSELSYESENAIENKAVAKGKADIIVNSVSGNIVLFPDGAALPVENLIAAITPVQSFNGHDRPWAAGAGKSKVPVSMISNNYTDYGINITVNDDGTFTTTGSNTGTGTFALTSNPVFSASDIADKLVDGQTYFLSGCPAGGSSSTYRISLRKTTNGSNSYVTDTGSGASFTYDAASTYTVYLNINKTVDVDGFAWKPMICLASETDKTWEPYSNICPITGWTGANIVRTGKNLLKNRLSGSGEKNSLTYVVNADGSITVNGTADGTSTLPDILHPADTEKVPTGSYILSGCPEGGASNTYRIVLKKGTTYYTDTGSGAAFTINRGENYEIYIRYNSGTVFNNLTFKPMIRLATEMDDTYEPYAGETYAADWNDAAGTVYAGSYDAISGKLKARPQYASYNGETLVGPWLSSMDVYEEGETPTMGAQVVDLGGTETEYALTPQQVTTLVGKNTVWADVGSVFVKYRADTKLYIDNKIAQAISAALNA